jgi:hypothetical protein
MPSFAPFIATWLIDKSGSLLSPIYYVIASTVVPRWSF